MFKKKQAESNPIAAACAVATLIIIEVAVRRCMKKYGRKA